jgi:hypothetical protein
LNKYKKVSYAENFEPGDFIYVVYRKDDSESVSPDQGYFLINTLLVNGTGFSIGNSGPKLG